MNHFTFTYYKCFLSSGVSHVHRLYHENYISVLIQYSSDYSAHTPVPFMTKTSSNPSTYSSNWWHASGTPWKARTGDFINCCRSCLRNMHTRSWCKLMCPSRCKTQCALLHPLLLKPQIKIGDDHLEWKVSFTSRIFIARSEDEMYANIIIILCDSIRR